ncbi:hypothetical protein BCY86_00755 [Pajaroellobacter abortibovis]|uniref:Uncharacterized protein n=2 Tax=Pajaroellobacter abortibovis TaxID=1882918 RepID=A0A1L6MV26_9BACT|nr:hypothetical protein BCY86_00755 [Pajaroellobacter abortibovis]
MDMLFYKPLGATFMKPSIDTFIISSALNRLFSETQQSFDKAINVGSRTGWIGKHIAFKAPEQGDTEVILLAIDPMLSTDSVKSSTSTTQPQPPPPISQQKKQGRSVLKKWTIISGKGQD